VPLRTRPTTTDRRSLSSAAGALTPTSLAWGRVAAGASMLVRPRALPQLLGVDSATSARVGWSVQMLGIRDLALGVGTLGALRGQDRQAARSWLALGVLCDAVDAFAIGGALVKGRVSKAGALAAVGVALGAVVVGAGALAQDETDI
jgi:hypothetical protein